MRPIDADSLKVRLSGCMILMPNGEKCTAKRAIDTQGTIEPEVRHGRWIAVSAFDACGGDEEVWMAHGNPTAYHYCSECKNETYLNEEGKEILSDYCPFCGADMREEGADNG
jgi:hypothetical protein